MFKAKKLGLDLVKFIAKQNRIATSAFGYYQPREPKNLKERIEKM
ncbi:MAG: cyclic lactone autoinducer peptide [Eubacteriales bacterium]